MMMLMFPQSPLLFPFNTRFLGFKETAPKRHLDRFFHDAQLAQYTQTTLMQHV